jgi:hypothetical protein
MILRNCLRNVIYVNYMLILRNGEVEENQRQLEQLNLDEERLLAEDMEVGGEAEIVRVVDNAPGPSRTNGNLVILDEPEAEPVILGGVVFASGHVNNVRNNDRVIQDGQQAGPSPSPSQINVVRNNINRTNRNRRNNNFEPFVPRINSGIVRNGNSGRRGRGRQTARSSNFRRNEMARQGENNNLYFGNNARRVLNERMREERPVRRNPEIPRNFQNRIPAGNRRRYVQVEINYFLGLGGNLQSPSVVDMPPYY